MRKQQYLMKIEHPCKQDWNAMSKNEAGKFCTECSKTVIDFSSLKDHEMISIIKQTNGKFCGRLKEEQVQRILESKQSTHFAKMYRILAGILLIGSTERAFATNRNVSAIEIVRVTDKAVQMKEQVTIKDTGITDSLKNAIKGRLMDVHSKEALPFASVYIKDSNKGTLTDRLGEFKLFIPDHLLKHQIHLVIACIGYDQIEMTIKRKDMPMTRDFLVHPTEQGLLGEIIVIKNVIKKKRWWLF